jgi:hypothetical protein
MTYKFPAQLESRVICRYTLLGVLCPHDTRHANREPEREIERIQTQMAQKPMLWAEVYAQYPNPVHVLLIVLYCYIQHQKSVLPTTVAAILFETGK